MSRSTDGGTREVAAYATRWRRAWCLVGALAIGLSFLAWSPTATLRLFVWSSVGVGVLLWLGESTTDGARPAHWWGQLLSRSLTGGALVVSLGFLVVSMPDVSLVVVLAVAGSSPWVVERVISESRRSRRSEEDLARLSDAELCRRWRCSYAPVREAGSPDERARVAAVRRGYLDELERRCPAALSAWLGSGAPASGGLEPFMVAARAADARDRPDPA